MIIHKFPVLEYAVQRRDQAVLFPVYYVLRQSIPVGLSQTILGLAVPQLLRIRDTAIIRLEALRSSFCAIWAKL